jgi:hypothetical protein
MYKLVIQYILSPPCIQALELLLEVRTVCGYQVNELTGLVFCCLAVDVVWDKIVRRMMYASGGVTNGLIGHTFLEGRRHVEWDDFVVPPSLQTQHHGG